MNPLSWLLLRSAFGRCRGDRDFTCLGLLTEAGWTLSILTFTWRCAFLTGLCCLTLVLAASLAMTLLLLLLSRLVHRIQNTEVVFGVLKKPFGLHPVAAAGRVPAKLEVFLEELLRGTADADIGAVAVKDVVAVKRNATGLMANSSATSTAATARSVVAATHTFHVHAYDVALSH